MPSPSGSQRGSAAPSGRSPSRRASPPSSGITWSCGGPPPGGLRTKASCFPSGLTLGWLLDTSGEVSGSGCRPGRGGRELGDPSSGPHHARDEVEALLALVAVGRVLGHPHHDEAAVRRRRGGADAGDGPEIA